MAKFCLPIATYYLIGIALFEILLYVFLSSHKLDIFQEHPDVGCTGHLMRIGEKHIDVYMIVVCSCKEVVVNGGESLVSILVMSHSTFVINVRIEWNDGRLLQKLLQPVVVFLPVKKL